MAAPQSDSKRTIELPTKFIFGKDALSQAAPYLEERGFTSGVILTPENMKEGEVAPTIRVLRGTDNKVALHNIKCVCTGGVCVENEVELLAHKVRSDAFASQQSRRAWQLRKGSFVVIGIGQSDVIDTAKKLSDELRVPYILVPTSPNIPTLGSNVVRMASRDENGRKIVGYQVGHLPEVIYVDFRLMIQSGVTNLRSGISRVLGDYYSTPLDNIAASSVAKMHTQWKYLEQNVHFAVRAAKSHSNDSELCAVTTPNCYDEAVKVVVTLSEMIREVEGGLGLSHCVTYALLSVARGSRVCYSYRGRLTSYAYTRAIGSMVAAIYRQVGSDKLCEMFHLFKRCFKCSVRLKSLDLNIPREKYLKKASELVTQHDVVRFKNCPSTSDDVFLILMHMLTRKYKKIVKGEL